MNAKDLNALEKKMRAQRAALFKTVADAEADLQFIAEDRESELEERAQEERAARLFARLDDRGKRAIEEIDAALRRIREKKYGTCAACREPIAVERLRALPAALFCIECQHADEAGASATVEEMEGLPRAGRLPQDLRLLSDRELENVVRETVHEDGRIDMDELRIVCRHGVAYLDGALPSAAEHRILLKLLTDVSGLTELVDRIQVKELLWEREDRAKAEPPEERPPWFEPPSTDDIIESAEEGVDYEPPVGPTSEEE